MVSSNSSVFLLFTVSDYPFGIFKLFCLSSIYSFWLPFWYFQTLLSFFYLQLLITLLVSSNSSVFLLFTASDYPFGISKLLSFFYLQLLIPLLVSSNSCLSSIYSFWLPFWYLQTLLSFFYLQLLITLLVSSNSSVFLLFTASDYPFGIFKLFCFSSIYSFWLPFWYLQTLLSFFYLQLLITLLVSSNSYVFLLFTASGYRFSIFKLLSFFYLQLLITLLVSSNSSVFLLFTASDYPFGIFKLFCLSSIYSFWLPFWYLQTLLSFFCLQLLITLLVSSNSCLSSIYSFWLPFWYLQTLLSFFYLQLLITLLVSSNSSVFLLFTASDYPFSFFKLFCLSSIYSFWLPFWYLQSFFYLQLLITLLVSSNSSVFLLFTASDYPFGIFKLLSFFYLQLLITLLVSSNSSVFLLFTASDYPFGIFKLLSFFYLQLLITLLVSSNSCLSSIYSFWLPLWYLQTLLSFFYLQLLITLLVSSNSSVFLLFTASDYPFGIFKLFCLSSIYSFWLSFWYLQTLLFFFNLQLLITLLVSSNSSVFLLFTASDYPFGIFKLFCLSSIYSFWLPFWYLQTLVFLLFTASDYPFGIFKLLSFFYLQLLITLMVSSNSSVFLLFTASDYPFSIFKLFSLSSIYSFWLPFWYLQTLLSFFYLQLLIILLVSSNSSVFLQFTASDYPFGIFKLFCLSSIYSFWLSFWYLQTLLSFFYLQFLITLLVSSVFLLFTASDYPFGIFKLFCLSSIYTFWLSFWYLQTLLSFFYLQLLITLLVSSNSSVFLLFTASDYPFGIFKLLCLSSIYSFWLPF